MIRPRESVAPRNACLEGAASSTRSGRLPSAREAQRKALRRAWIDFIKRELGEPHYAFSLTLRPVAGPRRRSTKIADAERALEWFLHVLNTRCFGGGFKRKGLEIGVAPALEGLGVGDQPHWHGVIRLPGLLPREKFEAKFDEAVLRTKRFGHQCRLKPYFGAKWLEYMLKTGVDSISPHLLRRGSP